MAQGVLPEPPRTGLAQCSEAPTPNMASEQARPSWTMQGLPGWRVQAGRALLHQKAVQGPPAGPGGDLALALQQEVSGQHPGPRPLTRPDLQHTGSLTPSDLPGLPRGGGGRKGGSSWPGADSWGRAGPSFPPFVPCSLGLKPTGLDVTYGRPSPHVGQGCRRVSPVWRVTAMSALRLCAAWALCRTGGRRRLTSHTCPPRTSSHRGSPAETGSCFL